MGKTDGEVGDQISKGSKTGKCNVWRAGEAWLARVEGPGGPQQGIEQVTSNWTRASV